MRSIRLENIKRFGNLEVDFYDEVKRKIRNRTVIVGKNGSGKTTILESIYTSFNTLGTGDENPLDSDSFQEVVFNIPPNTGEEFTHWLGKEADSEANSQFQENASAKLLRDIRSAIAGIDENPEIGNLIYFPTDRITHFEVKGSLVSERPEFKFCYRYDRTHKDWKGSLESFLVWLYFRDLKLREHNPDEPSKFEEFKELVNKFLEGKQITTVSLDYRVEIKDDETGNIFGLESLGSGEKQIVLLIGEILHYIRKGSIIMIDEPEIHLHPVWQRIFVDTLTKLCQKYDAQMILATQSLKIAESVLRREVISLDDLLEGSEA